jgi:Importin-beta N-terminal domain
MSDKIKTVIACLRATGHHDNSIRREAEERLTMLGSRETFGITLVKIGVEPSVDAAIRQQAFIHLKNYVKLHWSSTSRRFVQPQVCDAEKALIRKELPKGLSATERYASDFRILAPKSNSFFFVDLFFFFH